jgi:XTP/dITP diphosphohydrolase
VRLLIATTNPGKALEFRQMLGGDSFRWEDLLAHPSAPTVEETGHTFRANACLKASHYARFLNLWTVADDSGLEVDALGGAPGVYSARWAAIHGQGSGDQANNALLLNQLAQVPDLRRTARFVCVLALSDPQGTIVLTARDTVEGRVIRHPCGHNGFGYDPLFFMDELGCTTAQLEPADKHRVSHRGKALRRLRTLMQELDLFAAATPAGVAQAIPTRHP